MDSHGKFMKPQSSFPELPAFSLLEHSGPRVAGRGHLEMIFIYLFLDSSRIFFIIF